MSWQRRQEDFTKRDSVVDKIIANVYVIRNGDNRVLVFYIFNIIVKNVYIHKMTTNIK